MLVLAAAGASCGGSSGVASPAGASGSSGAGASATNAPARPSAPSFADDVAFLAKHGPVHVLESPAGARVALSAKYQGRVMTSSVEAAGQSFGWINRSFIEENRTGTQFDNYGGEDRLWLGPEGGQFGLYFAPGKPFRFDDWQVPASLQEGAWETAEATPRRAVFRRTITVTNWSGTVLTIGVERTVSLVDAKTPDGVRSVAFESVNRITNVGKQAWKRDSGLPSAWVLAMYAPSADTRIIIPFETSGPAQGTPVVNDAYFGKVRRERLTVREDRGFLVFTGDGMERGKIGLGPARAKPMLGSYSPRSKLLTVVQYDRPRGPRPYVNSMWEQQKLPYSGDVVNSYNDGSPGPGKPPLGGFYEIETSSPGAELAPGQSLVHTHRTFHLVGEPGSLEPIAKKMLGVSLAEIAEARSGAR